MDAVSDLTSFQILSTRSFTSIFLLSLKYSFRKSPAGNCVEGSMLPVNAPSSKGTRAIMLISFSLQNGNKQSMGRCSKILKITWKLLIKPVLPVSIPFVG